MLRELHIRDLVIVRQLELEFRPGMTALTGETGAGKSVLIDALGLALGEKTDPALIRAGCARAEVTAGFDVAAIPAARAWLAERDLDHGDDCLLRRVIVREGRSRAFVNGSPVPGQALRELGECLVDIHGQHAHQSLLRRAAQRQLLDGYGDHSAILTRVGEAHAAYRQTLRDLEALSAAASDRASRSDFLRFQVDELSDLDLQPGELERLDDEQHRLAHAERLRGESLGLADVLYDADDALQPALARAVQRLDELARIDPQLGEPRELLESARIQVEEAAGALRDYAEGVDLDPARLSLVDERLARIHDLARKHRVAPEALAERHRQLRSELDELDHADGSLARLREQAETRWAAYAAAAADLSRYRQAAAQQLAATVTEAMQGLAMAGGQFEIRLKTLAAEQAGPSGMDDVEFLVSANPGQPLAPLAKVASGGELSRISLAIQVATAGCGEVPTLIFDEVDVGIGGAVAEMVGRLLNRLGQTRQVLCITHLPQVAAQARQHLQVSKRSDGKTTETRIATLGADERKHEIARMLGGLDITEQTLAHAHEMMVKAAASTAGS